MVTAVGVLRRLCVILIFGVVVLAFQEHAQRKAEAAIAVAPTITSPAEGTRLTSFAPVLRWANPPGVTQYHLQVLPAKNDGPGVDLHIGAAEEFFSVPPPPFWYGLLPDMT